MSTYLKGFLQDNLDNNADVEPVSTPIIDRKCSEYYIDLKIFKCAYSDEQ